MLNFQVKLAQDLLFKNAVKAIDEAIARGGTRVSVKILVDIPDIESRIKSIYAFDANTMSMSMNNKKELQIIWTKETPLRKGALLPAVTDEQKHAMPIRPVFKFPAGK